MTNFRIGVPSKGRLSEIAGELLKEAGLSFRRSERSLFARCRDIPIDMGITGSDLVAESGAEVVERLDLGVGQCRLAICVPEDSEIREPRQIDGRRVATSFPRNTQTYLKQHGAAAHLVKLSGSVEVMIALGVADAIVDLVETGSTLAANHLRILDEIGRYQTVLIQSRDCKQTELADRVVRRLEGVVIARSYSLLEYNVPRAKLAEAEKITPGFNSPTVSSLEDPDWCAIRVMVKRSQVIEIMERLEVLGASAILEMQITNCRL
jgi:ATP phosphoribosyltransferase